jgi:ABC-type multidrug transport system ATPase subunit
MIELKDVKKTYSSVQAVRGVSLSIPTGCIYGIIGKSGAGKSTLIRALSLLERPDEGEVRYGDERVDNLRHQLRAISVKSGNELYKAASIYLHTLQTTAKQGDIEAQAIYNRLEALRPGAIQKPGTADESTDTSNVGTQTTPKESVGAQTPPLTSDGV